MMSENKLINKLINKLLNMDNNFPLVSVIVITYNSSEYVIQTLDSIKAQTYNNIELIISDDFSSDNTVKIVENWLSLNSNYFASVTFIKAAYNTGVAPNCNRGLFAAKGIWVKLIAGDDLLYPNALTIMTEYVRNNKECNVLFGRIKYLKNNNLTVDTVPPIFQLDQRAQKIKNLTGSGIKAPSSFLRRDTLISVEGFDERYPLIEDVPMWVKLSSNGHKFYFIDEFIAQYRIHNENISITSSSNIKFINTKFYECNENIIRQLIIPALYKEKQWGHILNLINYIYVMRLIIYFGNKNNLFSKILNLLYIKKTFNVLFLKIKS